MALGAWDAEPEDDGIDYLGQFGSGDVCWAKSGKRGEPWWPSQVMDLRLCPPNVLKFAKASHLCIAFFGENTVKTPHVDPQLVINASDMAADCALIAAPILGSEVRLG